VKLKLLREIAQEFNINWDSSETEIELNKKHDDLLVGSLPPFFPFIIWSSVVWLILMTDLKLKPEMESWHNSVRVAKLVEPLWQKENFQVQIFNLGIPPKQAMGDQMW